MLQLEASNSPVSALAFSPDSQLLATCARDGQLRFWDSSGECIGEIVATPSKDRASLAWSPSGSFLVCGAESNLGKFTLAGDTRPLLLKPMMLPISDLAFLSEDLLAVAGGIGVNLFDIPKREMRRGGKVEQKGAKRLAVHQSSKTLAWTTGENRLRIWKTTSQVPLDVPLGKTAGAVAFSPEGDFLAVAIGWEVKLIQNGDRYSDALLLGHKGQVSGVAFSADGRWLATASWDETVRIWDRRSLREIRRFPTAIGQLLALSLSPDGTRIAVSGASGNVLVIDAE